MRGDSTIRGLLDAADEGCTILAPTAELGSALFDAVQRSHVACGHEVWPTPRIRDFSGWLRDEYAKRQLVDPSLPRALTDIEERELWRASVEDSDLGREFSDAGGAARGARRARRAMAEHGIPLRALADHPTEESLALCAWTQRFEERCSDLGCVPADRLLEFAPAGAPDLVAIESPSWLPVARRWLGEAVRSFLEPPGGTDGGAMLRCHADSPSAELAACAEWARGGLHADPGFRAWICVPDLALRRAEVHDAFDAALAPQRLSLSAREDVAPYAVAGGTPLLGHAPVRAALECLSAATGILGFDAFSGLLRQPALQATHVEAAAAAHLDVVLRNRGPSEALFKDWIDLAQRVATEADAGPVPALERLVRFARTLGSVTGRRPMSRWIALWVEAFEMAPWALRRRWSSGEYQAAERFRELLGSLAMGDAVHGALSAAAAAALLQRAARDASFQPQTGIPSIWVSGQVIDPWLHYRGLWITGCSEERWPPPADPVPLLPARLQREYGVISAAADLQLKLAADLQRRWQTRARECVFSCADAAEGRPGVFSPLVPEGRPLDDPAPTRPLWRAWISEAPHVESCIDEHAPPFRPDERTRGVATLRAQSRCPFRGFAETRLAAEVLERPAPGFNQRERGDMLHHALERLWSLVRSSAGWAALDLPAREQVVENAALSAIERQCRRRDPGMSWRRRERARMTALLVKWMRTEELREPFEVEALEGGARQVRHGGLDYSIRIDRCDRLADGGRVLIDYKTGMAAVDWRGDRPDNPQLPIYALLQPEALVAVAYGRVNATDCGFVAESARPAVFKPRGRPSSLEGMPDFAALVELWSRRIEAIALEFSSGVAAVTPTARACASCDLKALCRIPSALDEEGARDD